MSRPSHSFVTAVVLVAVATVLTQVVQGGSPAPQATAAPQTAAPAAPPAAPQQPPAAGTAAPAGGFGGGRGAMTNSWNDIKNSDLVVIMGGNAAEAHPCGFKWVTEAKANNGAKLSGPMWPCGSTQACWASHVAGQWARWISISAERLSACTKRAGPA